MNPARRTTRRPSACSTRSTRTSMTGGKIILVNFMYHKIMVVDMEAFPGAPSENEE